MAFAGEMTAQKRIVISILQRWVEKRGKREIFFALYYR